MRKPFSSLILLALCSFLSSSANPVSQQRPIPPGLREGQKQINKPLDPPLIDTPGPNAAKLKREGDELAQLSAGVPSDLARVARGQLPKDLAEKLKRIEKLARNLRNELSR
jgi:hypothetical protein